MYGHAAFVDKARAHAIRVYFPARRSSATVEARSRSFWIEHKSSFKAASSAERNSCVFGFLLD